LVIIGGSAENLVIIGGSAENLVIIGGLAENLVIIGGSLNINLGSGGLDIILVKLILTFCSIYKGGEFIDNTLYSDNKKNIICKSFIIYIYYKYINF